MGLHLFRERLLSFHSDVLAKTVRCVVASVAAERRGEAVNRPVLASVCRMLSALRLYASHLERELEGEAQRWYEAEGARCMAAMDVPSYLAHAEACLRQERDRTAAFLDTGTSLRRVLGIVEQHLLATHASALLDKGFAALAEGQRSEDLRRMYTLLARVGRTDEMRRHFADYTKVRGGTGRQAEGLARACVCVWAVCGEVGGGILATDREHICKAWGEWLGAHSQHGRRRQQCRERRPLQVLSRCSRRLRRRRGAVSFAFTSPRPPPSNRLSHTSTARFLPSSSLSSFRSASRSRSWRRAARRRTETSCRRCSTSGSATTRSSLPPSGAATPSCTRCATRWSSP